MKYIKFNKSLHGLRGLLALLVVLYHIYSGMTSSLFFDGRDHLSTLGAMSVNIFFVISGYLIIQSLFRTKSITGFIKNRLLRIYPVFTLIHLLIFIAGPIIKYDFLAEVSLSEYIFHFFTNLLMLPGIFSLPIAQIVAWSLSYEMFFYIVAAAIYFLRKHVHLFRNNTVIALFSFAIIVLSCFISINMLFFVVGVLSYIFEAQIRLQINKINGIWISITSLISILVAYISYTFFVELSLMFTFIFFMTIISERGIISSMLSTKFFVYLGAISYSLYLWHTFVMFPLKRVLFPIFENTIPDLIKLTIVFGLLTLFLSIFVSHYSYKFIETRFISWLRSRKIKKDNAVQFADV